MKQLKLFTNQQLPQSEAVKEFVFRLFPNAAIWQKIKMGKRSNTFIRFDFYFQGNNVYSYLKIEKSENEEPVKSDAVNRLCELGATMISFQTVNLTKSPDLHTLEKCCFFLSEVGECANCIFLGDKLNGDQVVIVKESNNQELVGLCFWAKNALINEHCIIGEYCSLLIDRDGKLFAVSHYSENSGLFYHGYGLFVHKKNRDNLLNQAKGRAIEDFYQQNKEVAAKLLSDSTGLNFEAKAIDKYPYMTNHITASFVCHYTDKFKYDIVLYFRDMPSDYNRHGWRCEFILPKQTETK